MGKLNAPRDQPYDFKVFEMDGVVWLFDDSVRTYICSAQGVIFAEPLYWMNGECDDVLPDANYFDPDVAKTRSEFLVSIPRT